MSVSVTTDIFCDGSYGKEPCLTWIQGPTRTHSAAVEARAEARKGGWVRRDGRDLCPDCAKEGQ